jgi:DNA-binding protein HU-beta
MSKKKGKNKFSIVNELYEGVLKVAEATKTGAIRVKRSEFKKAIEDAFGTATKAAAGGERVRFPVIGTLLRKEVKARKAGKGVNPFTGEPMVIKARPASKKPRWSFPKTVKETFANKKFW